ncbi:MAG: ribonuclease P protein subunit RPR2 [Halobacteriales archaeon]|jgi:ribonuclease P protein subunit RPR2
MGLPGLFSPCPVVPRIPTPYPMTVAEERIDRLVTLTRDAATAGEDDRAREYVRLARRIAERHRLDLPRSLQWFTCDNCDRYLVPGENARFRTQEDHVVITCDCGTQSRHPYDD